MTRLAALALLFGTTGCFALMQPATGPGYAAPDPAQQRAAMAQSMGYPTKKSLTELEQTIEVQTKDFKKTGRSGELRLEAPEPFVFDGVNGTCYTVVIRLADGAAWGLGAEAGLRFDFQRPEIAGSGGPGVVGPGAVASVGCAEATGPIRLTMAPMFGTDAIGQGAVKLQLYSHVQSRAEKQQREADKRRQIAEQEAFAAQEREREAQREEQSRRDRQERDARDASERSNRASAGSSSSSSSSGSTVSVTIRSACSRTVPVFYGKTPKYGSGTTSSVSSNSISSHSFRTGDMMWVLDGSGNGLGSITISESTRSVEIDAGCSGVSSR
jgi:hypothetical protein